MRSISGNAQNQAGGTCPRIAIFFTGYVGDFVIDTIWPSFYYSPVKDGKNVWLLVQLAYMVGVIIAASGVKRLSRAVA